MTLSMLPFLDPANAQIVVSPDGIGPGWWVGGPAVVRDGKDIYLAYRSRRPEGVGRGVSNTVARSKDGVSFEVITELRKDAFGAESLERPALVRLAEDRWRIYVSCATPGTKHWRVVMIEADHPRNFDSADFKTVLPGDDGIAVKDPVIVVEDGLWHLWSSNHPLDVLNEEDRMTVDYATSDDGIDWQWQGTAMTGRSGHWDERGVRPGTVVHDGDRWLMIFDGRATAAENFEERTGVAFGDRPGHFEPATDQPDAQSPFGGKGLRYVAAVPESEGSWRYYYECARKDGSHDLRTEVGPLPRLG